MRFILVAAAVVISTLSITTCSTITEPVKQMPVTTGSDLALEFYESGVLAFDRLKYPLSYQNLQMAVDEDPEFFMAYFYMYFMADKSSKKVAEKALQSDAPLNEAEQEIKTAFKYLLDGQDDKVVEHLKLAIDRYPSDPHLYKILYILQFQYMKDVDGCLETLDRAIDADPDYPLAYNQLGYALMDKDDLEGAEKAFDTYIKLAPHLANPYDSKGDFYMHTKQFEQAYDSYMKAYETDSDFIISEKKAKKARYLLEKAKE